MAKLIATVRIKPETAEVLREKAIELTIATKEIVREADIVHYILERDLKSLGVIEWSKYQE